MLFSQRQGIIPPQKALQLESIDDELRNKLWNNLHIVYWNHFDPKYSSGNVKESNLEGFLNSYWHSFFKWPLDDMPRYFKDVRATLRKEFFSFTWNRIFDFIEFTIENSINKKIHLFIVFTSMCNKALEEENSGYRIIDGKVTPVTSEVEIKSIEDVLASSDKFSVVKTHISTALNLLANRDNPDYRNSIKESICAVESICKIIAGDEKATLGDALKTVEKKTKLHPAFKSGLSKLYGYTNDADGIRHALSDDSTATYTDAKFMLVTCSAFVNYLIGKAIELNIDINKPS